MHTYILSRREHAGSAAVNDAPFAWHNELRVVSCSYCLLFLLSPSLLWPFPTACLVNIANDIL